MTHIKAIYSRPPSASFLQRYKAGEFRSVLNLACYDKRLFASLEIDTDLDVLNRIIKDKTHIIKYLHLPPLVLVVVGAILTIVGIATSIVHGAVDWILGSGVIIICFTGVAWFLCRLLAVQLETSAFRSAEVKLTEFNTKYSERGLVWKFKIVPLTKEHYDDTYYSCLRVVTPTLFIQLPSVAKSSPPNRIQHVSVDMTPSSRCGSNASSSRSKRLFCLHCGSRSAYPSPVLSPRVYCEGCKRPIELSSKYSSEPVSICSSATGSPSVIPVIKNMTQCV